MMAYSKEYIFQECTLYNHCLEILLKENIQWGNKLVDTVFVMECCLTEKEMKILADNRANGINTFGYINVRAFISSSDSVYDTKVISIDTNSIMEVWKNV